MSTLSSSQGQSAVNLDSTAARMSPTDQLVHQVQEAWEKSLGSGRTFALGKENPCPVTINGITRKFAIRKDSGAGQIKLRMLVKAGYGPTFVHYALDRGDLVRIGVKPATESQIDEFEALFLHPDVTMLKERSEIIAEIQRQLQPHGWSPCERSTAVAMKTYDTAVGPKDAVLYLADWGASSDVYILSGNYESEGRNALSTTTAQIPKSVSKEGLLALVNNLAPSLDQAVSETYAARLLRTAPTKKMR